jgi:hypothetical protein
MRAMFAIDLVAVTVKEAANEPWLAFRPRQEVTITRHGEYTRVVLIKKPASQLTVVPRPAWA